MSNRSAQNLLLLFDRPQEPAFTPKGDGTQAFDVPQEYLPEVYRPIGNQVLNRYGNEVQTRIPVRQISLPNLGDILNLGRNENFSLFMPRHRQLSGRLISIFMGMQTTEDLMSMAVYSRDRVNAYMFNYSLSVTLLHRQDTQTLNLPSFVHCFPGKYIDSRTFVQAREDANIIPNNLRQPIEIPRDYTATDLEEEHRIAYFREDLGINLHHWHWHLVYPFEGPTNIVNKNRRGELFYYMHQQLIARYNLERFSNSLSRVIRFNDWRQPIPEGYFPKLNSRVASRGWPPRLANQQIQDLNRELDDIRQDVADLDMWRDRIFEAIHSGSYINAQGQRVAFTEFEGIDVLGNIIESSTLSPNRPYYGDIHNMGHVFLSYIHDPDGRHLESFGVIGDTATAMRDPVFYRWHAYIDSIFQTYKNTLPRYTIQQLNYDGISVTNVEVATNGGRTNVLNTYFQKSDVDLSRGMDFQPRGAVLVRFTHLQHVPFVYRINVNNTGRPRRGTCRIFLAPKTDERGNTWLFREQRTFFIELDKFPLNLSSGQRVYTRQSTQSSVTIPFERTFRDLDTNRPTGGDPLAQFNFCGCGWPQHMLVPQGTVEGLTCQLFVMISNYEEDTVDQSLTGICNDADSYCGIKDRLYPDRRAMGFPFDRYPRTGVETLQQFLTPNMRAQDILIVHDPSIPIVQGQNTMSQGRPNQVAGNQQQLQQLQQQQFSGQNRAPNLTPVRIPNQQGRFFNNNHFGNHQGDGDSDSPDFYDEE